MNIYLGFDISTSNVGMSVLNELGDILMLKHISFKTYKNVPENLRIFYKAIAFEKAMIEYKDLINDFNGNICGIFVEEPLIGSNNQFTASLLQKFNGMATLLLYKIFNYEIEFISVHESRRLFCPEFVSQKKVKGKVKDVLSFPKELDKKMYILEKVSRINPTIKWFYDKNNRIKKESFDMSDSVCVNLAKLIQKEIIKPIY